MGKCVLNLPSFLKEGSRAEERGEAGGIQEPRRRRAPYGNRCASRKSIRWLRDIDTTPSAPTAQPPSFRKEGSFSFCAKTHLGSQTTQQSLTHPVFQQV